MSVKPLSHGAAHVQALLDAETRPVPPALRSCELVEAGPTGVSRSRYTARAFHDLEVEHVWSRCWQMACREEQIASVGDSIVYDIATMSFVVVRTAPDEIRAFRNTCLHRGTQLRTMPGRIFELRCPFHGFTWKLDGTFAGMPSPWDFPDIDGANFCLPQASVGRWGGFVFIALEPTETFESYLEILPQHFSSWPLGERRLAAHVVRILPCNWKVALEAFIEAYHTVAVHPQLLTTSGDTQTQYDVWSGVRHVSRMITPVAVTSEHVGRHVSEQEIVEAMFMSRDDPEAKVAPGQSARALLADRIRAQLTESTGRDYARLTDCEALDAIEYFLFPNFVPWAGYTTPLVYRYRPNGNDCESSIMDVMLLEPLAEGGERTPSPTRHLEDGQRWADAPELGYLGRIFDQDSSTLGRVQRGLSSAPGPDVTLAREQEARIRHLHATLSLYVGDVHANGETGR